MCSTHLFCFRHLECWLVRIVYSMTPKEAIVQGRCPTSYEPKNTVNCLAVTNANVSEKFPILVIGLSASPWFFRFDTSTALNFSTVLNRSSGWQYNYFKHGYRNLMIISAKNLVEKLRFWLATLVSERNRYTATFGRWGEFVYLPMICISSTLILGPGIIDLIKVRCKKKTVTSYIEYEYRKVFDFSVTCISFKPKEKPLKLAEQYLPGTR